LIEGIFLKAEEVDNASNNDEEIEDDFEEDIEDDFEEDLEEDIEEEEEDIKNE
jgi:hypothetical protein